MTSSTLTTIDKDFEYNFSFDPVDENLLPSWFLKERTRWLSKIKKNPFKGDHNDNNTCILYWMQRDMRTLDNQALLLAQEIAKQQEIPLHVMHVMLIPGEEKKQKSKTHPQDDLLELHDMTMTERYGKFYLDGLEAVHEELQSYNVPLHIVHSRRSSTPQSNSEYYGACHHSQVAKAIMEQVLENKEKKIPTPQLIICDMSPLRHLRQWHESNTLKTILEGKQPQQPYAIPLWQVDAHNVVPVWHASPKREVGARTLRSKIHKLVDDCLQASDDKDDINNSNEEKRRKNRKTSIPSFVGNQHLINNNQKDQSRLPTMFQFERMHHEEYLQFDDSVPSTVMDDEYWIPGTKAALQRFDVFVKRGLPKFAELRNDPNYGRDICSQLSPYFNFGHLSFAICMVRLQSHNRDSNGKASFIEEGLVRKELSDNFLWYSPRDYDSLSTAAGWAQETLATHAVDRREHIYSLTQFENALTHDDLWNASQLQLKQEGKLHGFLRMYWAKKILEWSSSPAEALYIAQYLNDHYALDGRCPNGFVGVGWSIMGIHDQGWKERDIFGKIRYMNYKGCQRKFNVAKFVEKYPPALENANEILQEGRQKQPKTQNSPKDIPKKRPANKKDKDGAKKAKT